MHKAYEPSTRARLGTAANFCEVIVLKLITAPNFPTWSGIWGSGCGVERFGFPVSGFGFLFLGLRFRVSGYRVHSVVLIVHC